MKKSVFAERLFLARTARNLTHTELSRKIKVARSKINSWENDKFEPKLSHLLALSDALGVDVDWLITDKDKNDFSQDKREKEQYELALKEKINRAVDDGLLSLKQLISLHNVLDEFMRW